MAKKLSTKIEDSIKLKKVIGDINKLIPGANIDFADKMPTKEKLSFGVKDIDKLTGGLQYGNFTVIYGSESSGKSTLALSTVASAQKDGKTCMYIDLEHSFSKARAEVFGVDLSKLLLVDKIEYAEEAMDIVKKVSQEAIVDFIVVDSIQAMSPKGEQETKAGKEKSIESDEMALLARKMGKFLRVSGSAVHNGKVGVLMIGQIRTGGLGTFVVKSTLTGGNAIKHWSVLTLFMRRGQKADAPTVKEKVDGKTKQKIVGFDSVIKIEKTKVSDSMCENSDLHLPFYLLTGYNQEEIGEINDKL